MPMFDGFPFVSKKERARRSREFEKRVVPFGLDEQRAKLKETIVALFPDVDVAEAMFAFYDAKDAYTKSVADEDDEPVDSFAFARARLRKLRWMDADKEALLLKLLEMENGIASLDEYPTAEQVRKGIL